MSASTSVDKLRKNILGSVFLTIFLDLVGFGMLIPILPLIAREFGASDAGTTVLASLYSLATLLAVGILGRLSDQWGRRRLVIITIAVSCVAQVLTGLATSFWFLLGARFIAGLSSGNIAVVQASISDITNAKERGRSMALIGIAFGLGFALGPAFGALVSYFYPEQSLKVVAGCAALLNIFNLVFVARRLPETHRKFAKGEVLELVQKRAFRQGLPCCASAQLFTGFRVCRC
jgi:MFS transporter, DHA1 family, tetracycline resistance protein